jgi:hypothetical protein
MGISIGIGVWPVVYQIYLISVLGQVNVSNAQQLDRRQVGDSHSQGIRLTIVLHNWM